MPSTTATTSSNKHGMTMRNRSPKAKPTGTASTTNKASKPSKAAKAAKATNNTKASKVTKNTNTNKAPKNNKVNKPKKIMARYVFTPEALQTLRLYKDNSNAQFVEGYLKKLNKQQNAPEKGIEITVSVSEGFEFLGWTKEMVFRDIKFAKEMGMELDDSEFKTKWNDLE
jgi:vancomycin resistance protein YoaR